VREGSKTVAAGRAINIPDASSPRRGEGNVAGGKREARNPRFAKCRKIAHAEGVRGDSSHAFSVRKPCQPPRTRRVALRAPHLATLLAPLRGASMLMPYVRWAA